MHMANLTTRGNWDPFAGLTDLIRWDPFKEAGYPVFQRYFEREASPFVPRFEVRETKDALIVKADLPGVKTEDIDVSVHGNVLSVSGKREQEKKTDDEQFHMVERSFGSFTRSFTIPDDIDSKKLEAELKEGVLTVTLPKGPEAKPQKVQVKASR
jgi:HSP20 family protein